MSFAGTVFELITISVKFLRSFETGPKLRNHLLCDALMERADSYRQLLQSPGFWYRSCVRMNWRSTIAMTKEHYCKKNGAPSFSPLHAAEYTIHLHKYEAATVALEPGNTFLLALSSHLKMVIPPPISKIAFSKVCHPPLQIHSIRISF